MYRNACIWMQGNKFLIFNILGHGFATHCSENNKITGGLILPD